MDGTVGTLLSGALLLAGALVVPGCLLVEALAPELPRAGRVLAGITTGLLVVPTLAFGAAMALHTNIGPGLLVGVGLVVSAPALVTLRRRRSRSAQIAGESRE